MAAARSKATLVGLLRRLPEPTLAGHVTLTFLVIGLPLAVSVRNNPLLLAICALLATLIASYFLTWWASGKLVIERRIPPRVPAGEAFEVRVRITNTSRWRPAFGVGFRDALQIDSSGEVTCGPTLPMLAPGATAELAYAKRIHRRGVYNVSNALVATRFPLGVFEHRVLLTTPSRIVVLPPIGRITQSAKEQLSARDAAHALQPSSHEGQDDFHTLREFRPGDNPRLIHWRTSARARSLVRRVMHEETDEDIAVILDTCVGRQGESRHLETAISCAATLLVEAQKSGCGATVLFAHGRAVHGGSREGLFRALETLASVGPTGAITPALVQRARQEGGTRAVFLAVGSPADEIQRAAEAANVRLVVWDATKPEFREIFRR
ncbi:MAG: DUF58 domain-containing protein [Planctomycetota bacterium]|jgi:uncharacterized protein (DUF58 family)